MLRYLPRTLRGGSSGAVRRHFHQATGDFTSYDVKGVPTTTKVPIIVGEPGQTYVLVPTDIGRAFHTASLELNEPTRGISAEATDETCKATFFHDSQHFGVGGSSKYPQLRIPMSLPRQTDSNTSPATIYLNGKMHNMVLDGTADGKTCIASPGRLNEATTSNPMIILQRDLRRWLTTLRELYAMTLRS